jgi:pimeloyl-ACP methyl ester carboxylesterase
LCIVGSIAGDLKIKKKLFDAISIYNVPILSNWTWFTWVPTSMKALVEAETRLLKGFRFCLFVTIALFIIYILFEDVKSHIVGRFLPIRMSRDQIWTLTVEKHEDEALLSSTLAKDNYPLVLMHGFAGGSGQWLRNFDAFAETRTVYAFDLLGIFSLSANQNQVLRRIWPF